MLESGQLLGLAFEVYEAHIPYLLQFFVDYNLEGMNYLHLGGIKFRSPLPSKQDYILNNEKQCVWTQSNIPVTQINGNLQQNNSFTGRYCDIFNVQSDKYFDRQSVCSLEVDVSGSCILNNSLQKQQTQGHNNIRYVPSLVTLWEEEKSRQEKNQRSCLDLSLSISRDYVHDNLVSSSAQSSIDNDIAGSSTNLSQSFFKNQLKETFHQLLAQSKNKLNISGETFAHPIELSEREEISCACDGNHSKNTSNFSFSPSQQIERSDEMIDNDNKVEERKFMSLLMSLQSEEKLTSIDNVSEFNKNEECEIITSQREFEELNVNPSQTDGAEMSSHSIITVDCLRRNEKCDKDSSQKDGADISPPTIEFVEHDGNEECDIIASQREIEGCNFIGLQNSRVEKPPCTFDIENFDQNKECDIIASQRENEKYLKKSPKNGILPISPLLVKIERNKLRKDLEDASVQNRCGAIDTLVSQKEGDFEEKSAPQNSNLQTQTTSKQKRRYVSAHGLNFECDIEVAKERKWWEIVEANTSPHQEDYLKSSSPDDSELADPDLIPPIPRALLSGEGAEAPLPENELLPLNNTPLLGISSRLVSVLSFIRLPPSSTELLEKVGQFNLQSKRNTKPFYSEKIDLPTKPIVYANKTFRFASVGCTWLDEFQSSWAEKTISGSTKEDIVIKCRTPVGLPPTFQEIENWLNEKPTHAPDFTPHHESNKEEPVVNNLTFLSLEVHVNTRADLLPDPLLDGVDAICYVIENSSCSACVKGVIMICKAMNQTRVHIDDNSLKLKTVRCEEELFYTLIDIVHDYDPDFFVGYEVQSASFGYLIDRAMKFKIDLLRLLSRLPSTQIDRKNIIYEFEDDEDDTTELNNANTSGTRMNTSSKSKDASASWGMKKASGIYIIGRVVLNLWRMVRSELKLSIYTLENVVHEVYKKRLPKYDFRTLTNWFKQDGSIKWRVVMYYLDRAQLSLSLLNRLQLITRTCEMARLFGIDFFSVLSRGSQYRVEAVMLRVTKRFNYVLISPSRQRVAAQAPMECIPLVMEPESAFYHDPVVVLDFQSLYPSMMIAYNMCYSTLIGRFENGSQPNFETSLGVMQCHHPDLPAFVESDNETIISPNGVLFCSRKVRQGILPLILSEILRTRVMIKNSMKEETEDEPLKVLFARQLALKMIANVTYGYTAAGFSGRMPCAQLADAIVQFGRSTLEDAVQFVESCDKWKDVRVVYGDTDSLFVLLKGRTKEEAFKIGQAMADAITLRNPKPVKLKMEKVYTGSILVSKKRYVGMKFEDVKERKGSLEAKGIEIVRRDSCGVVQKLLTKCLTTFFNDRDLSKVRSVVQTYWNNIMLEKIRLSDFIFAKEVRFGTYSSNGSLPPAALVSKKAMLRDRRAEPRYAERIPYVVVNGPPGARLIDLVVSPNIFINSPNYYTINCHYYITKQIIPALERLLLVSGVNVRQWYMDLPRIVPKASYQGKMQLGKNTIDSFYLSKHCALCDTLGSEVLCENCMKDSQKSYFRICYQNRQSELALAKVSQLCIWCQDQHVHLNEFQKMQCQNFSCDIRMRYFQLKKETIQSRTVTERIEELF